MEPILSVSHLQKVYGDRGSHTRALDDLSFDVLPGEFVGVMGASGSGKTTLLNCVSTIDRPSSGTITVDGTDVTALRGKALSRFRRERLGFVFQDCNLLDTLTAFEQMLSQRISDCENLIYGYAGGPFNINSTKQLGTLLFETLELPHGKKTKSGYSTNIDVLEQLKDKHPIIPAIIDYRMLTKLRSTYAEGLLKVIGSDGRIHTARRNQ